jgi:Nucleotidyltransferase domain
VDHAGQQPAGLLPVEVRALTGRYLEAIDDALPGFVEGLYVVGSAALGAWQPGVSDVDTLIVTSRAAGGTDLAVLAEVHAAMPSHPHFDGVYLSRDSFAERPADRRVVPFVVNGELRTDRPCGELTPVVWLVLDRYGVPVRGRAIADLGVSPDRAGLRRYNLDNLRTYWQPLADQLREHVRELDDQSTVDGDGVAWIMLGPARLHYTLACEDIISKARCAEYVATTFPSWAALAGRAARWRAGEKVAFTVKDLREGAASIDAIVADAWTRWGSLSTGS